MSSCGTWNRNNFIDGVSLLLCEWWRCSLRWGTLNHAFVSTSKILLALFCHLLFLKKKNNTWLDNLWGFPLTGDWSQGGGQLTVTKLGDNCIVVWQHLLSVIVWGDVFPPSRRQMDLRTSFSAGDGSWRPAMGWTSWVLNWAADNPWGRLPRSPAVSLYYLRTVTVYWCYLTRRLRAWSGDYGGWA